MFVMFPEWKACGGFVPCIWRNPINPTLTSVESRPRPTLHTVFSKTHSQIWTLSHRRELTFQLGAKLKKQILKIVAPAVFSQMVGPFDVYRFAREREREKDKKKDAFLRLMNWRVVRLCRMRRAHWPVVKPPDRVRTAPIGSVVVNDVTLSQTFSVYPFFLNTKKEKGNFFIFFSRSTLLHPFFRLFNVKELNQVFDLLFHFRDE